MSIATEPERPILTGLRNRRTLLNDINHLSKPNSAKIGTCTDRNQKYAGGDFLKFRACVCTLSPRLHLHTFHMILSTYSFDPCGTFETCARIFRPPFADHDWSMFSKLSSKSTVCHPYGGSL